MPSGRSDGRNGQDQKVWWKRIWSQPIDENKSEETLTLWHQNCGKRWCEAIEEEEERLQINKDFTVQCIGFCAETTEKMHAVLQQPFDKIRVSWWQHFVFKKSHSGAYNSSTLPCSKSFEVHTYYYECCQQQRIKKHNSFLSKSNSSLVYSFWRHCSWCHQCLNSQWVLGWWMVDWTCKPCCEWEQQRQKQETNRKERAEHALCTYIQDEMTTFLTLFQPQFWDSMKVKIPQKG